MLYIVLSTIEVSSQCLCNLSIRKLENRRGCLVMVPNCANHVFQLLIFYVPEAGTVPRGRGLLGVAEK